MLVLVPELELELELEELELAAVLHCTTAVAGPWCDLHAVSKDSAAGLGEDRTAGSPKGEP